jgi:hypothetical protein
MLSGVREAIAFLREMHMRTKSVVTVTLAFWMIVSAGSLDAQGQGSPVSKAPTAVSGPPNAYVQPFGVPLAPPVYFVNFLLLYWSNPEVAANMPAYRAALPQRVYECLFVNPEGCPYPDMAPYFAEQVLAGAGGSRNKNADWPAACQADPRYEARAPRDYRSTDQINEPLGAKNAEQLARALGIDQQMILTRQEYACLIGGPGEELRRARELIILCSVEFTNSKGHSVLPLSSYGLALNNEGGVRSLCASDESTGFEAPCLEANDIFAGPLQAIAAQCGFERKLFRLFTETPMPEFIKQGGECQAEWKGACIAESPCPGNGAQSNNSCAPSLATQ